MWTSRSAVLLPLLTLSASLSTPAAAQRDPIGVRPGHVARLTVGGDSQTKVIGVVQRITGDSIFVRALGESPNAATPTQGFPLRDVSRVDVRVGHSNGIGAAIGGAFLGLVTAFVVDRLTDRELSEPREFCFIGCTEITYRYTESRMPSVVYPLAAGGFGALFYVKRRGDRWASGVFVAPPVPLTGRVTIPARVGWRLTF